MVAHRGFRGIRVPRNQGRGDFLMFFERIAGPPVRVLDL